MNWLKIFPFLGFMILTALISGKIFLLQKRGVKVSSGNENPPRFMFILYPVFFILLLAWVFELAKPVFHFQFSILNSLLTTPLADYLFLEIAGALLIFISLIFMGLTLHNFKASLRFGLNENNRGELITNGIFSFSRNPFFLSIMIYFLGTALVFPSWFFIGFAVLAIFSIHLFILKEEKFMDEHFGESYREYRKKVRRYF
ncbi:Protein-S-isoprenylcysteine O-methyltransferase Ste14 [Tangfeifania diversioriginum]|uniref:Protein-S-isoprenylcysteine O-methyltransferase Ste14 n=1 Tax=Tangfeifania diversioriginum TaxID=1168035 RepID=A0A1M6F7S6_9BACT|nr:isoprenylcysteine carboxylmethyltransferase family protein [Tangfeifania diversioriginum]SHI93755.1 Protein-S-isoprenylcysteine O-methyltransferase Ste14 [Tangfeifania diversioriginum]